MGFKGFKHVGRARRIETASQSEKGADGELIKTELINYYKIHYPTILKNKYENSKDAKNFDNYLAEYSFLRCGFIKD